MPLHTLITEFQTIGVDTPADLKNVEKALDSDRVYKEYALNGSKHKKGKRIQESGHDKG